MKFSRCEISFLLEENPLEIFNLPLSFSVFIGEIKPIFFREKYKYEGQWRKIYAKCEPLSTLRALIKFKKVVPFQVLMHCISSSSTLSPLQW